MNDQLCWVTGASAGIGRAAVERFAQAGARVLAVARRQDRLEELVERFPGLVRALALDVTDTDALRSALEALPEPWSQPTLLLNNAGAAFGLGQAQNSPWEDWKKMVDLNVTSLMFVTHFVLPGMVARNRGHIINLGSVAGTYPYKGGNIYGACKAFVEQFSLNLRCDLLGHPIRVTNIEPGAVHTEFSEVRFQGDKERAAAVYQGFQPITSEDVAESIFWCANLPPHVNINRLEMMPVAQTPAGFVWHRE